MSGYTREIHDALNEARDARRQAAEDREEALSEAGLSGADTDRFGAVLGLPQGDARIRDVARRLSVLRAAADRLDKVTEDNWFVCDEEAGRHEYENPQPVFLPDDPQGSLFDSRPEWKR